MPPSAFSLPRLSRHANVALTRYGRSPPEPPDARSIRSSPNYISNFVYN